MRLLEHYETLAKSIKPHKHPVELTINKAASLFSCTERNAKILIQRMQAEGWIEWQPGKGRGHTSQIRLLQNVEEIVFKEATKRAQNGSIDVAIQFVQEQPEIHQQAFISWLSNHLQPNDSASMEDHLRLPSYRPMQVLDPTFINRRSENHIMRHLFNQLVVYDETSATFKGDLAHQWSANADTTVWTFYLRKGVFFHNGARCTSKEIQAHFFHQPSSAPTYWSLKHLQTIKIPHRYIVEFHFHKPNSFFLHAAAFMPILHHAGTLSHPIGTGPFRIAENTEKRLQLSTFADFYGKRPFLDNVSMYFFPNLYDNQSSYALLEENRLNFYPYPYHVEARMPLQTFARVDRGCKMLTVNACKETALANETFRHALYHLLEPKRLIRSAGGNRFTPASRLIQSTEKAKPTRRRKEVGRSLLQKSSYRGETLFLYSYNGAGNEEDASWIKAELENEGILIEIVLKPYHELTADIKQKADMLLGEQLVYEDPCYTYLSAVLDRHGMLYYHQKDITEQTETLLTGSDSTDSFLKSLNQIEQHLCYTSISIPLYRLKQFAIYPPYAQGIALNTFGWVDYTKMWYKHEDQNRED